VLCIGGNLCRSLEMMHGTLTARLLRPNLMPVVRRYHNIPQPSKNTNMLRVGVWIRSWMNWTGIYRVQSVLPIMTHSGRPGRYPFVGIAVLIAANGVVWWYWQQTEYKEFMTRHFLCSVEAAHNRPWTLVSDSLSHQDITHLLGNMVALTIFGWRTWRAIGVRE
jgi:membrane associated rhomboid family serine protease